MCAWFPWRKARPPSPTVAKSYAHPSVSFVLFALAIDWMKEGEFLKSIWITFLIFWFGLPNSSFLSSTYSKRTALIENDLAQLLIAVENKAADAVRQSEMEMKIHPPPQPRTIPPHFLFIIVQTEEMKLTNAARWTRQMGDMEEEIGKCYGEGLILFNSFYSIHFGIVQIANIPSVCKRK